MGIWYSCARPKMEYLKVILYNSLKVGIVTNNNRSRKYQSKVIFKDGPRFLDDLQTLIELPTTDVVGLIVNREYLAKEKFLDVLTLLIGLATTEFTELIEWIKEEY